MLLIGWLSKLALPSGALADFRSRVSDCSPGSTVRNAYSSQDRIDRSQTKWDKIITYEELYERALILDLEGVAGGTMDLERRLKRALDAVDDAQRALKRAQSAGGQDPNVQRALRELDDAEADIRRALREIRE